MTNKNIKLTKDWLNKKYVTENHSAKFISKLLGVSESTVFRKLRKFNIPIKSYSQSRLNTPSSFIYKNKEWLEEHYVNKKMSSPQIAKLIGITHQGVLCWLKEFDISTRNLKESSVTKWVGDKNPKWNNGSSILQVQIRNCSKYDIWRTMVFKKDFYSCVICNDNKGNNLNADHIIPFSIILVENNISSLEEALICEKLWDINNGRTLCVSCHRNTETYGWKMFNILKSKGHV